MILTPIRVKTDWISRMRMYRCISPSILLGIPAN
jgi:hypothetical protein